MGFISYVLSKMAMDFSNFRTGPNLNSSWLHAYSLIDGGGSYAEAVKELCKERKNWMHRKDLLIRASRHYEGAMLAFIRRAVLTIKTNSNVKSKPLKI
jgi:fucokinase